MADLQKTLNANTSVASVGAPPPPSGAVAGAIADVGSAVKSFVADKKKDRITEELKALGDDVFAATTGKEVKRASDRFNRLKSAREQGAISQTMINIEAEAILKEEIDKMPAFAPELRRHAASILGFDPTGSQIRALLDVPEQRTKENGVLAKFRENAEAIAATTGADINDIMKLQGKSLYASQQADLIAQQATLGNAGRVEIFNATMKESDGFVSDLLSEVVQQVNAGGVSSPEQVMAQVSAKILGHKQALRARYAAAGLRPDPVDLSREMAAVDEQWGPIVELAQAGALSEMAARDAKSLTSAMTVEGFNVMGDVAMIYAMQGSEGVRQYHLVRNKFRDPDQIALLKANDPVLSRNLQSQAQVELVAAAAYKKVMGIAPKFGGGSDSTSVPGVAQEAVDAMSDRVFMDVIKDRSADRDALLSYAEARGQKFKVLGGYFQKGAKEAASPQEIRFVTQTFQEEYPQLVERISGELLIDGNWKVEARNGELVAYDPKTNLTAGLGTHALAMETIKVSPAARGDLIRLNSFNRGIQNGWSADLGQDPKAFLNKTAATINEGISKVQSIKGDLDAAIQKFESDPSSQNLEAIRKLDPALVADIERMSQISGKPGEE